MKIYDYFTSNPEEVFNILDAYERYTSQELGGQSIGEIENPNFIWDFKGSWKSPQDKSFKLGGLDTHPNQWAHFRMPAYIHPAFIPHIANLLNLSNQEIYKIARFEAYWSQDEVIEDSEAFWIVIVDPCPFWRDLQLWISLEYSFQIILK